MFAEAVNEGRIRELEVTFGFLPVLYFLVGGGGGRSSHRQLWLQVLYVQPTLRPFTDDRGVQA